MENFTNPTPPAPQSGKDWIDKTTLDVFDYLISFLDNRSLVILGMVCKMFREAIEASKLVWLRIAHSIVPRYHLPPGSIDVSPTHSTFNIRRIATLQDRLGHAIRSSDSPCEFDAVKVTLDHLDYDLEQPLELTPVLLPGGRWMFSFVVTMSEVSYTHIFCWDLSEAVTTKFWKESGEAIRLKPVAHESIRGILISSRLGDASVQLDACGSAVNIATQISSDNDTFTQVVFQLQWLSTDDLPTLKIANTLNRFPLGFSHGCDFTLEGDYMVMDTVFELYVWNWKTNGMCKIDAQGHQWANHTGFHMAVQPPYIIVITHDLTKVCYLRIPELDPIKPDADVPSIPAPEIIEHTFLKKNMSDLRHSKLRVLSSFIPYQSRSNNTANLRISRAPDTSDDVDVIVDFKNPHQPPRVTRQSKLLFAQHPYPPLSLPNDTIYRLYSPFHLSRKEAEENPNLCTFEMLSYVHRRGNFTKPLTRNIDVPFPWRLWGNDSSPGTLCGVSGVGLIAQISIIRSPNTVTVVRFL